MGSLALRPGDSLTVPKTALSVSFTRFVSSTDVTQATGLLTLAPVGLTPTEHVSLSWTHSLLKTSSAVPGLCFRDLPSILPRPDFHQTREFQR